MTRMARLAATIALLGLACAADAQRRATVSEEERQAAESTLAEFTSPTLTRFSSDEEFKRYVLAVRTANRARGGWWADSGRVQFALAQGGGDVQSDAETPLCPENDPDCLKEQEGAEERTIYVTGSRINPRNPSITNNQFRNVEEGDIVKQIDRFLLILQDGRIFVVDTRARGRRLALTDRANVYRDSASDMWYDEMLVFGDRVLITGYSYDEEATELTVFRLDSAGRLAREGVFHLSSDDYYSGSNYATRLIGDSLVIYTPLRVGGPYQRELKWPVIRRWLPAEEREQAGRRGVALIDATRIYRPVRATHEPVVHTVSVCPLGAAAEARSLPCRATAFVGPEPVQWIVTGSDVFLWTASDDAPIERQECEGRGELSLADSASALLYRIPVAGSPLSVVAARGRPPDQFSMHPVNESLVAVLTVAPRDCYEAYATPPRLRLLRMPLWRLGNSVTELPEPLYTALPSTETRWIANRFTDRYLVYGALSRFRRGLPDFEAYERDGYDPEYLSRLREEARLRPAFVVPLDRPAGLREMDIGHSVIRAEQVADDIVLTGYRDRGGLFVSLIDLTGRPRIASSVRLDGRYESEGRSHAFNSLVERDGSGLMGLPTVRRIDDADRAWWRSRASDLSFLEFDADGRIGRLGELVRRFDYVDDGEDGVEDEDGVPGYQCEVSCIDWYGNSRPIFTDGRIFALAGAELIEGRIERGRIREVQRINIALESVGR